jgi:hypothetical protein
MAASSLLWTGCNTVSQTLAPSNQASAQKISIISTLPNASVGSSYYEVLSISGGVKPYRFAVSHGPLPQGLVLNPNTGIISGTLIQAGVFAFTISVTGATSAASGQVSGEPPVASGTRAVGEPPVASGTRAYTVTIAPIVKGVTVQISPANASVAPGGKVQFSAAVSNTSNTAVTWSTSAGSISTNGLFVAPANISAKSITITASSVAETAQDTVGVTIVSSEFTITTSSVPSAVTSIPYSASLTASGGHPPYGWNVSSGSLPPGLQLSASTGKLAGLATRAGSFAFSVEATDAAALRVQQHFALDVSSSNLCGPPTYNCSRTDLSIVQVPKGPPSVGNLTGANTIVTDPDFGNRIVRITDADTDPGAPWTYARSFVSSSSGSADENLWNTDSTLFLIQSVGGAAYPFAFDPSTLHGARLYLSSYPSTGGMKLSDAGTWSRVNSNVLYTSSGTAIDKYDFTDRTNPPAAQRLFDFTSSHNCLPAGFSVTWSARGGVSAGDAVFGMAYSNNGAQGTGVYAVAYKVGSGCTILNTQTGHVTGDWGATGTVDITDRWTIHNAKLSKDGNWLIIARTSCLSSSCSDGPYFWQIGTTNVSSCGVGGKCGGHWTEGYSHWVNNDNSPLSNQVIRSFAESTLRTFLTVRFPIGITTPFDQHQSWNNADPADSVPFVSSTWSSVSPFPAPWYDEIIGVATDGSGITWRFAHSFITGRSQRFSAAYGIGSVSQDGKFFIFSSDWMGGLGSEAGARACTIGENCRGDVFVVELR